MRTYHWVDFRKCPKSCVCTYHNRFLEEALELIGHIQLLISFASVPRQRWVPNRGKQTAAPLSLKRGTRAELLHRKSSQCTQISPQGHRVRTPCPNKRRKDCVCHRVSNNEDADPHTILNTLLVLAMIERKLYSYQNARFKQNSQWRRKSWWCILPAALILWSRR